MDNDPVAGRITKIGKKGTCTEEDLNYFRPRIDLFWDMDFPKYLSGISSLNTIIDLIKGYHLIEYKYGGSFGFGSPGRAIKMIEYLEKIDGNLAEKLYDWIADNGGNYYIKQYEKYKEMLVREKNQEEHRLLDEKKRQDLHQEAVLNRLKNKKYYLEKSQKHNNQRQYELSKLSRVNKLTQLKRIINSNHPLDYYPEQFSNYDNRLLSLLSAKESEKLIEKLRCINRKSHWKSLLIRLSSPKNDKNLQS